MLESENEGEYLNVYSDGDMIVSVSEKHGEVAVYERDHEEPVAVHNF